ncbi:MAG TPA: tetratricopeptide repeat protein, partial [Longimicrobiaceae bacterium]|nr:tetratricopeptide repeat protein [Longimicrobiaceae bacterium]
MRRILPHAALAVVLLTGMAACAGAANTTAGGPTPNNGQVDTRPQVLVPDFAARSGAAAKTGTQVAEQLRRLVRTTNDFGAITADSLATAMKRFGLTALDSITARQLAQQLGAPLLLEGSVSKAATGLQSAASIVDVRTGDHYPLEAVTGANPGAVAQALFTEFQGQLAAVRQTSACNQALGAEQYTQALAVCDSVLAAAPSSTVALYGKATALSNTGKYQEALPVFEKLLTLNPASDKALLGAGLAASHAGQGQQALQYYQRYVQLSGADTAALLRVAGQVAQAGDYISAYKLVQPVASQMRGNADFQKFLLAVSTAAGAQAQGAQDSTAARSYYQAALGAYRTVYGDTASDLTALRQGIAINSALGNTEQALAIAKRATAQYDTSATIWSQYASALHDAQRYPEEIQALTRVIQINPQFEDVYLRRGMAYVAAGQQDQALTDLKQAATRGNAENVSKVLYRAGAVALQAKNYDQAATLLSGAFDYAPQSLKSDIGYYLGFALVQQGTAAAKAHNNAAALDEF